MLVEARVRANESASSRKPTGPVMRPMVAGIRPLAAAAVPRAPEILRTGKQDSMQLGWE